MQVLDALLIVISAAASGTPVELPFDRNCPVFHDNDDHRDVYTEEYLMALAHLGEIRLVGLTTTYAPNQREYEMFVRGRAEIVEKARQSGLKHLPSPMAGTEKKLVRPASNRLEDTQPLRLPASRALIAEARKATPERPLVFLTGGQLTVVADAWLQAPEIGSRVVVAGLFGVPQRDYNASLDPWAWTIVVSKFRVLAVPFGSPKQRGRVFLQAAEVPKARIRAELPQDVPLFRWMFEKRHPSNPGPDEHDYDGQAAIALVRPDFITEVRRWRPDGVLANGDAKLVPDGAGPVVEAVDADQRIATAEFWRAMHALRDSLAAARDSALPAASPGAGAAAVCRAEPRLPVLAAIRGNTGDQQSMIRPMLYGNELEIEGLIASASGTRGELKRGSRRRWRADFQADFGRRMSWCVAEESPAKPASGR